MGKSKRRRPTRAKTRAAEERKPPKKFVFSFASLQNITGLERAKLEPMFLVLISVVFLAPFLWKAANIDDPLFLWAAKQIAQHPLDPYGFNVHWYYTTMPMHEVTKNPPLASYYLAMAGGVFGWNEFTLHLFFLIPTIFAVLGIYQLSRRLCAHPFEATLLSFLSPAFLVSSTTLMCDIPMVALWIWAVVFWIDGVDSGKYSQLIGGATLVALAGLTKYFGVSLVLLLPVYAILKRKHVFRALVALLIPVSVFVVYQFVTHQLYGKGLLTDTVQYVEYVHGIRGSNLSKIVVLLSFLGGTVLGVLFVLPRSISRLAVIAPLALVTATLSEVFIPMLERPLPEFGQIQLGIFVLAGLVFLALGAWAGFRDRTPESVLLILWIGGVIAFGAVNWSVNIRSLLPLLPALGPLLVRAWEKSAAQFLSPLRMSVASVLMFILSFLVAWGDLQTANGARKLAQLVCAGYSGGSSKLWFQGHWGFQYYMQECPATPIEIRKSVIDPGDFVVIPHNNTNTYRMPPEFVLVNRIEIDPQRIAATSQIDIGAGFYSDVVGPLPYTFGSIPPEFVYILERAKE